MNRFLIIAFLLITTGMAKAQTDSAENFQWPGAFRDGKSRYNFVLLDGKGRPIKNIILLQPQQLIPLRQSYGKGLLWVEVYKEKQLIGKEKLYVADRF